MIRKFICLLSLLAIGGCGSMSPSSGALKSIRWNYIVEPGYRGRILTIVDKAAGSELIDGEVRMLVSKSGVARMKSLEVFNDWQQVFVKEPNGKVLYQSGDEYTAKPSDLVFFDIGLGRHTSRLAYFGKKADGPLFMQKAKWQINGPLWHP